MTRTWIRHCDGIYFVTFQLPPTIDHREIVRLARLFSPSTLETVALLYFDMSEATVKTLKADNIHNTEGFKRELLTVYRNKGGSRKVRILWKYKIRLALLFSPSTLETVTLLYFDTSEATIKTLKAERREDCDGFKRDLLTYHSNRDYYR